MAQVGFFLRQGGWLDMLIFVCVCSTHSKQHTVSPCKSKPVLVGYVAYQDGAGVLIHHLMCANTLRIRCGSTPPEVCWHSSCVLTRTCVC